eukprot:gene34700-42799_t
MTFLWRLFYISSYSAGTIIRDAFTKAKDSAALSGLQAILLLASRTCLLAVDILKLDPIIPGRKIIGITRLGAKLIFCGTQSSFGVQNPSDLFPPFSVLIGNCVAIAASSIQYFYLIFCECRRSSESFCQSGNVRNSFINIAILNSDPVLSMRKRLIAYLVCNQDLLIMLDFRLWKFVRVVTCIAPDQMNESR